MRIVTAIDVRKHLGELLDSASAGERILIERDHRPMAVLVSVEDANRLEESREERVKRKVAALDRLSMLAERVAREHPLDPSGLSAVEMIRRDREERTDQIFRAAAHGRSAE